MTTILGISAWYHDSACALLRDGSIVAAAQEERFTRIKGDATFPAQALQYCLTSANIDHLNQIDVIAFYDKPFIKFERLIETHLKEVPFGLAQFCQAMPGWIKQKLMARRTLEKSIRKAFNDTRTPLPRLLFNDHHGSHAAMAFYPGPFDEAAILCMDGVGEWATSTAWVGKGNQLTPLWQIDFPHSLGLLYSAFTSFCGFRVNSGEYKLMGLAPFGEPVYADLIEKHLISIRPDGSFRLNMDYFSYAHGLKMTSRKFAALFGGPALPLDKTPGAREMDLAASIQKITEKVILLAAANLQKYTGMKNLCLGGGVALNCVANAVLRNTGIFDNIWVSPAPGDAGSAIGCALSAWHEYLVQPRDTATDKLNHGHLGPEWSDDAIEQLLVKQGIPAQHLQENILLQTTAHLLAQGNVVGWFQGRMEFGPRALGNRSILADPRNADMIRRLNLKIKKRESFRPFAASVLAEKASDWFDIQAVNSTFMNTVVPVKQTLPRQASPTHQLDSIHQTRSAIAAVTHVDMSCRIHTVTQIQNPLFYRLISSFEQITGMPLLINTSFNIRGEPIVCSPQEALHCFLQTDMDILIMGNWLLRKTEQIV